MSLTIRKATVADIPLIREMSALVWAPTYEPILGRQQVDYMLELFYSPQSLEDQMNAQGQEFLLCYDYESPVVFAAFSPRGGLSCKLHKLYVLPDCQGKGAGRFMVDTIVKIAKERQWKEILLNVNRYNSDAIKFYEIYGFTRVREEDIDIGLGYFMNDYVYRLSIGD